MRRQLYAIVLSAAFPIGLAAQDTIGPDLRYLRLCLDGQSPTVLELFYTDAADELELSDVQKGKLSVLGEVIHANVSDVLSDDNESYDRSIRYGDGLLLRMISELDGDVRKRLADSIHEARAKARDILSDEQLNSLIRFSIKHLGLRALKYEEVSARLELSQTQMEELGTAVSEAIAAYHEAIRPRIPNWALTDEYRELQRQGLVSGSFTTSEEKMTLAAVNAEASIRKSLESILEPRQLERLEELLDIH